MEFVNNVSGEVLSIDLLEKFLIVLAPFAPHISEELWKVLGGKGLVAEALWPEFDASKLQSSTISFVVQVNGKFRGNVEMPKDAGQKDVEDKSKALPTVVAVIGATEVKKVIFVKNKLINFVV